MTIKVKVILLLTSLAVCFTNWAQAQEKQRKLEVNFGISTPGALEWQDIKLIDFGIDDYNYLIYDKPLSDLGEKSYNSTIYPCFSVEVAYKLAESGFFKRLDLVGFVNFHHAYFEEIDVVRNNNKKETAKKLDIMVGVRYNIVKNTYFNMYTQIMGGQVIRDKSRYWDIIHEKWSDQESFTKLQLTYLGFNWKIGRRDSRLGAIVELGYGYEYATGVLPFIPGIRTGFSYKF